MHKLVGGVHQFQATVFRSNREFFANLAQGQRPEALMVTCSDSRINPNMLTQTQPGELFILRNAGNIVPPYDPAARSGEQATIEFAVEGLGVKDIIVCGHSHCGAINGLLHPENLDRMPSLKNWLRHADLARALVEERYPDLKDSEKFSVAIQENVLAQIINLRTHPSVARALDGGRLKLHGWVYKLETGQVFEYDPASSQFLCVTDGQADDMASPVEKPISRFGI